MKVIISQKFRFIEKERQSLIDRFRKMERNSGDLEDTSNVPVRIISMHILKKRRDQPALFVKNSYELGFVNFLKRYFFKEHLKFGARTCVTKSKVGDNVCIKLEDNAEAKAYCVVKEGDIGAVLIASSSYPGRVAIKILHEVLDLF